MCGYSRGSVFLPLVIKASTAAQVSLFSLESDVNRTDGVSWKTYLAYFLHTETDICVFAVIHYNNTISNYNTYYYLNMFHKLRNYLLILIIVINSNRLIVKVFCYLFSTKHNYTF